MLTNHGERASQSYWDLSGASEVLNIALGNRGVDRVTRDRIDLGTRHFCDECGAL